eukprot:jgi/Picre1/35917/NNA_003374.t1
MGGLQVLQDGVTNLVQKGYKKMSPFFIPYAITNMGGGLLAIDQGLMGPNYSISTACATANYAFVQQQTTSVTEMQMSLSLVVPRLQSFQLDWGGFVACRALSQRCASHSVLPDHGTMTVMDLSWRGSWSVGLGELGARTGPWSYNLGRIPRRGLDLRCTSHDRPHPDGLECQPASRDKAEIKAIKKVFSPDQLKNTKLNATKSMIGHCLGAAGGMEAIATIQAIRTGYVHPTINHESPIEEVHDMDVVPNAKAQHEINVGISNSFGFGGHNSVVAFAPFRE